MLKEKAVEELGQASLLMPAWVKSALAANDRLKLYLTLLQSAWQQARTGKTQGMGFEAELRKAGCPDVAALDGLAERAYLDDDRLIATGLQAIFGSLGRTSSSWLARSWLTAMAPTPTASHRSARVASTGRSGWRRLPKPTSSATMRSSSSPTATASEATACTCW